MIENGLVGNKRGRRMWPHSLVDLYFAHRQRAACLGLIVNQGHPVQIYVPLRVIWDLLS